MNIPTKRMTRAEFEALPISPHGGFDQNNVRYLSATGQWIFVAPGECAVIEVAAETKRPAWADVKPRVEVGLFAR